MTLEKQLPSPKQVQISVAYAWDAEEEANPTGSARLDSRWRGIHRELSRYSDEAKKRHRPLGGATLQVRITRLRGQVGQFAWPVVTRRIEESDILVVDITPRSATEHIAPNVLLELGYCLARHPQRVFVVCSGQADHRILPSDLAGLIVGHYGKSRQDQSLRRALVNAILACAGAA